MILAAAAALVAYALDQGAPDVHDLEEVWSRPAGVYEFTSPRPDGRRSVNTPGAIYWRAMGCHIFDWNWDSPSATDEAEGADGHAETAQRL